MYFAQFFTRAVPNQWNGYRDGIIEMSGDRSLIILDGRQTLATLHDIAASEGNKRGAVAYQLMTGETFTRGVKELSPRIDLFGNDIEG